MSLRQPEEDLFHGPYIRLTPGSYRIKLEANSSGIDDDAAPILMVEVTAGAIMIERAELNGEALGGSRTIPFFVTEEMYKTAPPVGIKISQLGRADVTISMIALYMEAAGAPGYQAPDRLEAHQPRPFEKGVGEVRRA